MTIKLKLILAAAALAVAQPTFAAEYVMSASADYSGPFADVMPNAMSGLIAINNWWNKEVGEKLGVKVDIKITDMRYDAAVIARTWPSILSRDKPIMHLGFGSPDLTTLMKRLPNDKVPMLIGTTVATWDDAFVERLAGRFVIRYDLRDSGRSTTVDPDSPGYTLRDLVADAVGVLDALGIARAHVAGLATGFIFIFLLITNKGKVVPALVFAVLAMLLYIPSGYYLDSYLYRRYLRRQQQQKT